MAGLCVRGRVEIKRTPKDQGIVDSWLFYTALRDLLFEHPTPDSDEDTPSDGDEDVPVWDPEEVSKKVPKELRRLRKNMKPGERIFFKNIGRYPHCAGIRRLTAPFAGLGTSRGHPGAIPTTVSTAEALPSCTGVLLLCTWSLLYLAVPGHIQLHSLTGWSRPQRDIYQVWTKKRWVLLIVLAPECLLGSAFAARLSAWRSRKDMREFMGRDETEWFLFHAMPRQNLGAVRVSKEQFLSIVHYIHGFNIGDGRLELLDCDNESPKLSAVREEHRKQRFVL
ncbi:hypothetical protein EJ06DRAFT_93066 [Trichodelitschia bisporula]|uniref:Uncharacterized protein n=1 Tax=Trichodelitschia bisporula TaxID=703511 RepID=A0A6G1HSF4_9PEZI|nr:hypothetical protein EJ06DRAFT_93066 [Trichodelitschia bisporula]